MKRKIAAALSIIMIGATYASPFVHAEDPTVTGTSSIANVNDSVLQIVVPTSAALDFTLDPKGLVSIAESGQTSSSEDAVKQFSGRILGNKALIFANKSLKDVTVTTKFKVTTSDTTNAPITGDKSLLFAANASTNVAAVKSETNSDKANLVFLAVPNKDPIVLTYADGENAANTATEDAVVDSAANLSGLTNKGPADFSGHAAAKGILFKDTDVEVKSVIPAAKFDYKYDATGKSYSYELKGNNSAAGFVVSGFCNPYFKDYAKIDGKLGITATYSFKAASADDKDTSKITKVGTDAYAARYVTSGATQVEIAPPTKFVTTKGAPSGSAASTTSKVADAVIAADGSVTFTYVPGTATPTATLDSSYLGANYNAPDTNIATWANSAPVFASNKLSVTLSSTTLSYLTKESNKYVIKLKDTAGNTFTVNATSAT